jgi:ATP-binding cassette subfamily F protein uup
MAILVDLEAVTCARPGRSLFDHLSVTVADGDRLGIVGINGTGKSTLLRVMAGTQEPESGTVRRGRGTRVELLDQQSALGTGTVREVVGEGWESEASLERLGVGHLVDTPVAQLSGGQAKRVALARALTQASELLILDEPTNHLDLGAIAWLEGRLAGFRGGLVVVTHDRFFLDRVTNRILELDRGAAYVHEGGYASWLEARAERESRAASAEGVRRNLARRELAWLRRGAPARTRKPLARILTARAIVEGRPQAAARTGDLDLAFAGVPRLGDQVLELSGVGFTYDQAAGPSGSEGAGGDPAPGQPVAEPRPILADVSFDLGPGDRLAIVGANGTGKTTLLDLLAGRRQPRRGTLLRGPTVRIGYYRQTEDNLDPDARVRELVAGPSRAAGSPEDLVLMERFWFDGDAQWARVGTLSGGERRRLQLLLVLAERPNVLLLDEPTNDLDLDTLRALEDLLDDWPGSVVVVSHDRAFLEQTSDRILECRTDGTVADVPGGLAAWLAAVSGGMTWSVKAPAAGGARPGSPANGGAATAAGGRSASAASGPKPGAKATRASAARADPPARSRSASTLGQLMRTLERDMAKLERRRDSLTESMSATTDHVELSRLGHDLAAVAEDLAGLEEQWLALAEESEARRV